MTILVFLGFYVYFECDIKIVTWDRDTCQKCQKDYFLSSVYIYNQVPICIKDIEGVFVCVF